MGVGALNSKLALETIVAIALALVLVVIVSLLTARRPAGKTQSPTKLLSQAASDRIDVSAPPVILTSAPQPMLPASMSWTSQDGRASGNLIPLEPYQLDEIAAVAQAPDNQWETTDLLRRMQRQGLGLADVAEERNRDVRGEYIRALVNSSQLVINRAFMYNSSAINRDYLGGDTANRRAFMDLLDDGVIVPYLYNERSPGDPPDPNAFDYNALAFEEWRKICQEVTARCVRLSWSDETNAQELTRLNIAFDQWCHSARFGDDAAYARHLAISAEELPYFRKKIEQLSELRRPDGKPITRQNIYENLISITDNTIVDGKPRIIVSQGYYRDEPGVAPLKQLVDLRYNTNLSDFMSRYAVTPIESPPRIALQQSSDGVAAQRPGQAQDLLQLLKQEVYSIAMDAAYLRSMDALSLEDVKTIRRTDEWRLYQHALLELTRHPFEFGERSKAVHDRYVALARVMTNTYEHRMQTKWEAQWLPRIHLVITMGAGIVLMRFNPLGAKNPVNAAAVSVIGDVGSNLAQKTICRIIIGGAAHITGQANLAMSMDFINARYQGGQAMFDELKSNLRQGLLPNIEGYEIVGSGSNDTKESTLTAPEEPV